MKQQVIIPQKSRKSPKWYQRMLESKGFYVFLTICLISIGMVGYVTSQKAKFDAKMTTSEFKHIGETQARATIPAISTDEVLAPSVIDSELEHNIIPDYAENYAVPASVQPAEEPDFMKPVDAAVSKPFSGDDLIYSQTTEDWRTHMGIDFSGSIGTPVKAAADGTVEKVYKDEMLGTVVIIKHSDTISSLYSSLQTDVIVKEGERITAGKIIGGIGNTAMLEIADQPHLHFEIIKEGSAVDPNEYIEIN